MTLVRATTDDHSRYSGLQEFTLLGGKTDLIHILVGHTMGGERKVEEGQYCQASWPV